MPTAPRPVSYTHLDVYKRQLYGDHVGLHKAFSSHLAVKNTQSKDSFTHVEYVRDVYKRQEMPFIEVSRCLGLSRRTILGKHVLINVIGPVMVNLTLVMATAVLSESGLSFLGLGDPNTWS